jgi:ubiquinone/menaquinone biosynthesis C-methylase UbiE
MNINKLNKSYKSKQGDILAIKELLPIVKKYINVKKPKILEVGCGYGRNLFALSHLEESQITGCDISSGELKKAEEKMKSYQIINVNTVLQKNANHLPFADNSFDFIVIWQVLEHVLSKKDKVNLLNESVRVVKNKGHILIETPNFLFPFDYHDNNLPLVHWILPNRWRYHLTRIIRDEDFPPSQYTNIYQIKKILKQSPHLKSFQQKTKVYFEEKYKDIFKHMDGTRIKSKILFFLLYAPIFYFLRLLRLPGDMFTPSIRVIFEIKK